MDFETARFNMVEQQIRPWEVLDQTVLNACRAVPREAFAPKQYQNLAFTDTMVDIGHGQFMMAPKIEARLLQALNVQASDRILEIGTGTGYFAALLATLGAQVTSVDLFDDFTERAAENLRQNGITNVELHVGDALDGWRTATPYDVIAVTGSSPARRQAIEEQLSIGGRMFIIVGMAPVMEAALITRVNKDTWGEEILFETELAPLIGAETGPEFRF